MRLPAGARHRRRLVHTLKQLLRKRREHGLESWVLLLDMQSRAFDRVPRELLWPVLLRLGVPPKLVRLLQALHEQVHVGFDVNGVTRTLMSVIGIKQGDLLGLLQGGHLRVVEGDV